jgi:predicted tellurium resistance membrane protein TerC
MRIQPTAITELPQSPDQERRSRMIRYAVAMGIRMVCIVVAVIVPDWWKVVPLIGAISLPYIAVVIANNVRTGPGVPVARPGAVVPVTPRDNDEDAA